MQSITINTGMINKNVFPKSAPPLHDISESRPAILSEEVSNSTAETSKPDVDTYAHSLTQESDIKSIKDLFSNNLIKRWEHAKQNCGDDSFKLYSGAQHLVFSEKLQEMGFFDGMSDEEKGQFQSLLQEITTVMNYVNQNTGTFINDGASGSRLYCYEGKLITMPEYDEAFYNTYSDEAKLELESATAALQAFSQKYLSGEKQEDFESLIQDFHTYNSEYLKTYQSFEEKMVTGSASMSAAGVASNWEAISDMVPKETKDYLNGIGGIVHTKEETDDYLKNISNLFKLLNQSGSNVVEIWGKIEENYSDYSTNKTNNTNFKDYILNRSEDVFDHMKSYWSKLLTD